jgi:hypothetical protein
VTSSAVVSQFRRKYKCLQCRRPEMFIDLERFEVPAHLWATEHFAPMELT